MNRPDFKHFEQGERPSASEYNRLIDLASALANSLHIQGYVDSSGFHTRRFPPSPPFKVFEVQSEAAGDGVYNCIEQSLRNWADTGGASKVIDKNALSLEVLNLSEYDPAADYVAQLVAGDLIVAWRVVDIEDAVGRWIGLPLSRNFGRIRKAYCKNAAGAATTIVCYLDTDATGTEVTVNCTVIGGNLNKAIPRLADGTLIFVSQIGADWYCVAPFQVFNEQKGLVLDASKLQVNICGTELQFDAGDGHKLKTNLDECPI